MNKRTLILQFALSTIIIFFVSNIFSFVIYHPLNDYFLPFIIFNLLAIILFNIAKRRVIFALGSYFLYLFFIFITLKINSGSASDIFGYLFFNSFYILICFIYLLLYKKLKVILNLIALALICTVTFLEVYSFHNKTFEDKTWNSNKSYSVYYYKKNYPDWGIIGYYLSLSIGGEYIYTLENRNNDILESNFGKFWQPVFYNEVEWLDNYQVELTVSVGSNYGEDEIKKIVLTVDDEVEKLAAEVIIDIKDYINSTSGYIHSINYVKDNNEYRLDPVSEITGDYTIYELGTVDSSGTPTDEMSFFVKYDESTQGNSLVASFEDYGVLNWDKEFIDGHLILRNEYGSIITSKDGYYNSIDFYRDNNKVQFNINDIVLGIKSNGKTLYYINEFYEEKTLISLSDDLNNINDFVFNDFDLVFNHDNKDKLRLTVGDNIIELDVNELKDANRFYDDLIFDNGEISFYYPEYMGVLSQRSDINISNLEETFEITIEDIDHNMKYSDRVSILEPGNYYLFSIIMDNKVYTFMFENLDWFEEYTSSFNIMQSRVLDDMISLKSTIKQKKELNRETLLGEYTYTESKAFDEMFITREYKLTVFRDKFRSLSEEDFIYAYLDTIDFSHELRTVCKVEYIDNTINLIVFENNNLYSKGDLLLSITFDNNRVITTPHNIKLLNEDISGEMFKKNLQANDYFWPKRLATNEEKDFYLEDQVESNRYGDSPFDFVISPDNSKIAISDLNGDLFVYENSNNLQLSDIEYAFTTLLDDVSLYATKELYDSELEGFSVIFYSNDLNTFRDSGVLVNNYTWSNDSSKLYFDNSGSSACIWELDFNSNQVNKIVPEHEAENPVVYGDDILYRLSGKSDLVLIAQRR